MKVEDEEADSPLPAIKKNVFFLIILLLRNLFVSHVGPSTPLGSCSPCSSAGCSRCDSVIFRQFLILLFFVEVVVGEETTRRRESQSSESTSASLYSATLKEVAEFPEGWRNRIITQHSHLVEPCVTIKLHSEETWLSGWIIDWLFSLPLSKTCTGGCRRRRNAGSQPLKFYL